MREHAVGQPPCLTDPGSEEEQIKGDNSMEISIDSAKCQRELKGITNCDIVGALL